MLEFKVPELGENITGGIVVKINVSAGDTVQQDQALMELETDKATIEVPAPEAGVIREVMCREGQEVNVGQVIIKMETEANGEGGEAASPAATPKQKPAESAAEKPAPLPSTPAPEVKTETPASKVAAPVPVPAPAIDIAAAPSVRRLARELGIDITRVTGSGPGGRILKDDVKSFAKSLITGQARPSSPAPAARPLPDFSRFGEVERKPMNNIRRKTAEHLSFCWQTIPHVTQFGKVDITDLDQLRKKYSTQERKLTVTPFLMKVMASALKTFPQFNASLDMEGRQVIHKKYCHIGVAVDTERGLLVPVIRDVDKKSIYELTDELTAVAEKARNGKITLDDLQGGCITLTNLGGIGGTAFTPIVNWPEVAILGVSRAQMEPAYTGQVCHPRLMLPLSLSYDHRLIDGADGARFLMWIIEAVKQPFMMDLTQS